MLLKIDFRGSTDFFFCNYSANFSVLFA